MPQIPAARQDVVTTLASMVVEQATTHGFAIEVDAIRDAVDQSAKFAGIEASEDERMLASQRVELEAQALDSAIAKGRGGDFVPLHMRG